MPLVDGNSFDYWGNSKVKCPFCDAMFEPWDEDIFSLYEEGEHIIDCPKCEKRITVHTAVSHTFSTDKN